MRPHDFFSLAQAAPSIHWWETMEIFFFAARWTGCSPFEWAPFSNSALKFRFFFCWYISRSRECQVQSETIKIWRSRKKTSKLKPKNPVRDGDLQISRDDGPGINATRGLVAQVSVFVKLTKCQGTSRDCVSWRWKLLFNIAAGSFERPLKVTRLEKLASPLLGVVCCTKPAYNIITRNRKRLLMGSMIGKNLHSICSVLREQWTRKKLDEKLFPSVPTKLSSWTTSCHAELALRVISETVAQAKKSGQLNNNRVYN